MERIRARDAELIERSGKPEVGEAFEFIAAEVKKLAAKHGGERVNVQRLMQDHERVGGQVCAAAKAVINQARFDVYGTANYPDATFTLRLAFGTVKGYEAGTTMVPPKTTFNGLFERNAAFDNQHPYDLPQHWLEKKGKLDLDTPYNFVCTADIIGGNSGSPVVNTKGELVGLIFDGNLPSLVLDFAFEDTQARATSVDARAIKEALIKVYDAKELADKLGR
ncbi:MAG: S46 family peptidase [Planctomycetes bacterium]|nr:S46 family peptidase [Planctomycetota bacterium]